MKRLSVVVLLAMAFTLHGAPSLRVAYTRSSNQVWLQWPTVTGAVWYDIQVRSSAQPVWSLLVRDGVDSGSTQFHGYAGAAANTAYAYRVTPLNASLSPIDTPSNAAMIVTHAFTDDPLTTAIPVKLAHQTELRTVMQALRACAGLSPAVWTRDPISTSLVIADEDIMDLRAAFNGAASALDLGAPSFVDPALAGQFVRRIHIQQLRDFARSYPEWANASASMSELYFSPNADGVKDTSTFTAVVSLYAGRSLADFRWRIDVRSSGGALVRTIPGTGGPVVTVWDGKDGAGTVQPDGLYTLELVDLDSLAAPITSSTTRIDLDPPVALISSPAGPFVLSNVRTGGSGSLAITGNASDAVLIDTWIVERTGNSQPVESLATGTGSVSSGTFVTWQTLPSGPALPNGDYVLKLTVLDKAGNQATDTTTVSVAHFSVARAQKQANVAAGDTVTYTSVVPFSLTERIDVRTAGSTTVRTPVNVQRVAGTYTDVWDGRDAQGALVADGVYDFVAVATEGSSSLTWNRSGIFPPADRSQYEYPKCWTGSIWAACSDTTQNFDFDSNGGKPLRIAYCVGTGQPDGTCAASKPALVLAKATTSLETSSSCDSECIFNEYQGGGRREILWYGRSIGGSYLGDKPGLTVIRLSDQVAENMTVVHGTAPVVTAVQVAPLIFSPGSSPSPLSGQTFTLNVTRYGGRSVTISATFRNVNNGAELRTVTTAPQSSDVVTLTWDGRATNGERVVAGQYEVRVTVTDSGGSSTTVKPIITVRY
jgi:flagellar hook assembly protein FlgD